MFRAIKLGFTPLRNEIYDLEIEDNTIYGKYRGKLYSRKDKIKYFLEAIFYAFLGLAEREGEGKYEEDVSKDFSYKLDEIKMKVEKNILKIKAKDRKMKFLIDKDIAKNLKSFLSHK